MKGGNHEGNCSLRTLNAFHTQPNSDRLSTLGAAVASGELYIPISKRFPLAEAPTAHALAEKGGLGKVLLVP